MYKKTGSFEDLDLEEFTWNIHGVNYFWKEEKVQIAILINGVLVRSYLFNPLSEWNTGHVIAAIMSLDEFKDSALVV